MIFISLLFLLGSSYGYQPNPCKNTNLRDALLDLRIKTLSELNGMTDSNVRDTAIVELQLASNEATSSLQSYSDFDLLGKIYVAVINNEEGFLSPGQMREYNTIQLRDSLIVNLNTKYGYTISYLHGYSDKELSCLWYSPMFCSWDNDYINDWDGDFVPHARDGQESFFAGIYSIHDNGKEDRRFKFYRCTMQSINQQNVFFNDQSLQPTFMDQAFDRSCNSMNEHSAISKIQSNHNNHNEDRVFEIFCSTLPEAFAMRQCSWTNYLNTWDGPINFVCPNNGVIRAISSYHDNHREDRLYKVECCRIGKEPLDLTNFRGRWQRIPNNLGGTTTYSVSEGIENSNFNQISNEYSTTYEHSVGVSVGMSLDVVGVDLGATYSFSYSTSKAFAQTLGSSITSYTENKYTVGCSKSNFYQWVIDGSEQIGDDAATSITLHTDWYLCTTLSQPPNCPAPPGQYCIGDNCADCRYDDFSVISSQQVIIHEAKNAGGSWKNRILNYDDPTSTDTFQLEWNELSDGSYKSKIVFKINDPNINLFDDNFIDPNIQITVIESTSSLVASGSQAYFCKACSRFSSNKPGDTCWALTPFSDNNRNCGCNSGGWTGQGIYYGGYNAANANICTGWAGAFAGQRYNGAKKGGEKSVGFRLIAVTSMPL